MPGYVSRLNSVLKPTEHFRFTVLDLFAGCGGLSAGFEAAGFKSIGIEMDKDCCDTYNKNLKGRCIQEFMTEDSRFPHADIVIGGPPCQPFSVRGKQQGLNDARNGFPVFVKAVEALKPPLWIFENVRGLMYKNRWYLDETVKKLEGMGYEVEINLINTVDFGVPQSRERVIVVGHKGGFEFPGKHDSKVTAGEAIEGIIVRDEESKFLTPQMEKYVAAYEKASKCVKPRDLHPDKPARTLTCRNLAGSTSDMHRVKLADGRRRRISVREAARLQGFPDWFEFCGTETSAFNQIGNAVPPLLAFEIAKQAMKYMQAVKPAEPSREAIQIVQ